VDRLNAVDRDLRPRLIEHNAAVKTAALAALSVEDGERAPVDGPGAAGAL